MKVFITLTFSTLLIIGLLTACSTESPSPNPMPQMITNVSETDNSNDLKDVAMILKDPACYMSSVHCYYYETTVYGDGRTTEVKKDYDFMEEGGRPVTTTTTLRAQTVRQLLSEFAIADFFSLEDSYMNMGSSDGHTYTTTLTIGSKTKSISHYSFDESAPDELGTLESRFKDMTDRDLAQPTPSPDRSIKWSIKVGHWLQTGPALKDGVLYLIVPDKCLCAFDAQTGTKKWEFIYPGVEDTTPIVAGDTVLFGTSVAHVVGADLELDGYIYAVNAQTGKERWRYKTDNKYLSRPVATDKVVYLGSDDSNRSATHTTGRESHAYALDLASGAVIWKSIIPPDITSVPALAGELMYLGFGDGSLHALNANTGKEEWKFQSRSLNIGGILSRDDTVYCSADNLVLAINGQTRQEKWEFELYNAQFTRPDYANGTLYFGVSDLDNGRLKESILPRYLLAIDAQSGQETWRVKSNCCVWYTPTATTDAIYYADMKGFRKVSIDGKVDQPIFFPEYDYDNSVRGKVPIENGIAYLAMADGRFIAINTQP